MSYENLPKNKTQQAVLTRAGAADYYTLSTDPFPTPDTTEGGAILEHTDTGTRYFWTTTTWVREDIRNKLIAEDYYSAVARFLVPNERIVEVRGSNPDVDSGLPPEVIWDSGDTLVYATANEQWEVLSSSSDDDVGGIGAQELRLVYMDYNYDVQEVTFPTSGITPSNLPVSNCFRSFRMRVTAVGSTGGNVGTITIRNLSGDTKITILPEVNHARQALYTIPAGHIGYLIYGYASIAKNKEADISLYNTLGPTGIFLQQSPTQVYQNAVVFTPVAPIGPFPEKSEIKFMARTYNNNARVGVSIQLHLLKFS